MFSTLKTLVTGANARAEERLRDTYAIELIDQKIREAEAGLKNAKYTLASLMQKQRGEASQLERIDGQIVDLASRATAALEGRREDLAMQAADAIARMENERQQRQQTLDRLEARVMQLKHSVERAHRRILDLKQGALQARAAHKEQQMQKRLGRHVAQDSAFEEAEGLIARVLDREDPFEQSMILNEIDADLTPGSATDNLAEAGFGPATKSTAADVLARLKTK